MFQLNGLSSCLGSNEFALRASQERSDEKACEKYVAERRGRSIVELRREVLDHDYGSFMGNFLRRIFSAGEHSDNEYLLKIQAARQVLEERDEQSYF